MTTIDTGTEDRCTICKHTQTEHKERGFKHEFSPAGGRTGGLFKRTDEGQAPLPKREGNVRSSLGGDPVLRMALIRKGIIEVADLDAVEAELRATGVAGYEPPQSLAQS